MTEKIKVASRAVRRGRRLRSRSQRPPAPSLSRSGREELESSHDEVCDSEASPATPKYYSRPPAPVAFFDADEPQDAHEDTFDETVDSELRSGPSTLRGGGSTDSQAVAPEVAIIEAQDEEGKEMDASFFKTESLAPVAYGAEDEEEAESSTDDEQVWLSRGERARRDRLRRGLVPRGGRCGELCQGAAAGGPSAVPRPAARRAGGPGDGDDRAGPRGGSG